MVAEVELLVGVSPRTWADRLHRFCEDHGGARVRARVLDEDGVLAQAAHVLLVDDTASYLSGRLVDRLRERGMAVVVVVDPTQFEEVADWVRRLGADAIVPADEAADRIVAVATEVAGPRPSDATAGSVAPDRTGRVIAVAGVSGGVGATEVALGVAGALDRALVVDLDLASPSVAQRLDLPLHPNLRSAVEAQRAGADPHQHLHTMGGLGVLGGAAGSGDWAGLDPADLRSLVVDLSSDRAAVVNLPAGPPMAHPHGAVTVADLTRPMLGVADVVLAVTLATPVGLSRTFEWLAAADGLVGGRLHVVVNRAPSSGFRRREARIELEKALGLPVWFLPDDRAVPRAGWSGDPVMRGGFRRAARRLAGVVAA